jgi:transcriptional regulator with XRE-family HTH domain
MHNALGKKITALREARGLKQYELAAMIRVNAKTVSHWEMGRRRVSFSDATRLALALGVPVQELAIAAIESAQPVPTP